MKFNKEQLKFDIKKNFPPLVMAALALLIIDLVWGKICPVRTMIGIPCPGCGLTRAFKLAMTGHFYQATVINPLWIAIILLVILYLSIRYLITDEKMSKKLLYGLKVCAIIIALLCIVYYIYRMICWFPDREPMVYDSKNAINYIRLLLDKF